MRGSWEHYRIDPVMAIYFPRVGESSMSVDRLRPEVNLLTAFSLSIAGALAIGLPLALAIIFLVR